MMRGILAAVTFLVVAAGGSVAAHATSVQITYTGSVTSVFDSGGVSGLSSSDAIAGSMTIDFNGITHYTSDPFAPQLDAFGYGKAKVNSFEFSGISSMLINSMSSWIPRNDWSFIVGNDAGDGHSGLTYLRFFRLDGTTPIQPVTANIANLQSLSQAGLLKFDGYLSHIGPDGSWSAYFSGTSASVSLAAAPIPGALPMFVSALGGVAVLGWRRRRRARQGAA
jgi:hypothetical protein